VVLMPKKVENAKKKYGTAWEPEKKQPNTVP
jgi:hypothetical protein